MKIRRTRNKGSMGLTLSASIMMGALSTQACADNSGYQDAVLADHPVGYWRFEDAPASSVTSNLAAGSGDARGVYKNVLLGRPSATPNLGNAGTFTADASVPSHVDLGTPQALEIGGDLTIEWWQYATYTHEDTGDRVVFSWAGSGEDGQEEMVLYELALRFSREQKTQRGPRAQFVFGHGNGAGEIIRVSSQAFVHTQKWYHVAVVRNAKDHTIQFYVNGFPSGEPQPYRDAPKNARGSQTGGAAIGRLGQSDKLYFQGALDEVAVYDHCLTEDRILAHYRAALNGVKSPSDMLIVGHRGNSRFAPENTLVSFDQGINAGSDIIEMDLHRSSDGVVVLIHDNTVDRTTNRTGEVASMTIAELEALDAGSWKDAKYAGEPVPTLRQTAELCKGRTVMMLDLKVRLKGDEITEVLSQVGIDHDQIIVAPWQIDQAQELRPYLAGAPMILLHGDLPASHDDEAFFQDFKEKGFTGFSVYWGNLNKPFVDAAHRHGLRVYAWTIDDAQDISGAVLLGVDGVITDDPAQTKSYLERISP